MKILIAGGGTGGHVFPGIAVAEELKRMRRDCEIVFVGTRNGLEAQAVPEAGFRIRFLAGSGFSRTRRWMWPWAALVNLVGLLQAFVLVLAENPRVVLGTGGYVSAPVAFAARLSPVTITALFSITDSVVDPPLPNPLTRPIPIVCD